MRLSRPHRDATADDLRAYLRNLGAALEAKGVDYGDPFEVVPARPLKNDLYTLVEHDEDAAGPAASSAASARGALANLPRSGTQRHRVLQAAVAAGERGVTSDELSEALRIALQSVKPRFVELRAGGWLAFNGRTRPSIAGARVEVHVATDKARESLGFGVGAPMRRAPRSLGITLEDFVAVADESTHTPNKGTHAAATR